jgi:hypothetical protein
MPISLTSPNAFNYYSGGGAVSIALIAPDGTPGTLEDAGYVQSFEITPKATILDHFNARTGIRQKDMSIVTEISGELSMTMEEWTAKNISLALMGVETDTPGTGTVTVSVAIFTSPMQLCQIKFQGFNTAGPQWTVDLPTVQMSPNKSLQFISEAKWGQITMQGGILGTYDSKSNTFDFGTATATFPDGTVTLREGQSNQWPPRGRRNGNGNRQPQNGQPGGNPAMPGRPEGTPSGAVANQGQPQPQT